MTRRSLRVRLVLASVVVEVVLLSLLVYNSHRLMHAELSAQAEGRLEELRPLLNAALAAPLAARDLATLQEILSESRNEHGIAYLVLHDHRGNVLAAQGWERAEAVPEPDASLAASHHDETARYDTRIPITLAGQRYGTLHIGVSTARQREAETRLLRQSLLIAAAEVTLTVVLLTSIGLWLTRHLHTLTDAARRMAAGDLDQQVPAGGEDEIAELGRSFNLMAQAVRDHVATISRSEAQAREHAGIAQAEQGRMSALLSAMSIGILFEDREGRTIYVNPALRRIWRLPEDLVPEGMPALELIRKSPNMLSRPDHFSRHVLQVTSTHEASESFEITLADGRVLTQFTYPVRDGGSRIIGRLWIYEDVTRERQTAEQLLYLAERDSLTGLYNRHRFQDELGRMLATGARFGREGALLFFDMDEFKYVNDTYGHRTGDSMLIRVAGELGTLVRRNEVLARLGGDEFAVLIPEAGESEACALAERIVRAVAQIPFRVEGQNLRLTASIGIAITPHHGRSAEELVSHADAAMYQAKESGKNAWRVYRPDLDASRAHVARMSWHDRIARALDRDLLRIHFQGVHSSTDRRVTHVEALVRMVDEHDTEQLIMPGHFISIAEQSGQIVDIDRWVIDRAVATLAAHPQLPAVAVNVSARSFDVPGLPGEITAILAHHEVEPKRLIVELTETAAVSDLHDAQRFIELLHRAGCSVCLDDFGTGFSSFAYLKHLPVDAIKIDGLFIRDLPNDRDNQLLVRAIADVARGLRRTTIAEYVEDEETATLLASFGVDMLQGYHLDVPVEDHPALHGDDGGTSREG